MAERLPLQGSFVIKKDIVPALGIATEKVLSTLHKRVEKVPLDPFISTVSSLRRTGILYAEPYIAGLDPKLVAQESSYFSERKQNPKKIKAGMLTLVQLMEDFEPVSQTYSELIRGRSQVLDNSVPDGDLIDHVRNHILWVLSWKVNWPDLKRQNGVDEMFARTLSYLKYLPRRLGAELNGGNVISLDELSEDLLPDQNSILPENLVIRRETWQEFKDRLEVLPEDVKQILTTVLSDGSITPAEQARAREALEAASIAPKQRTVNLPTPNHSLKQKFGLVDLSGTSLFARLTPGQIFTILSWLTSKQRYAVFDKAGYLQRGMIDGFSTPTILNDARESLGRIRSVVNSSSIPSFKSSLPRLIDDTINSARSGKKETAMGHAYLLVLAALLSSSLARNNLKGLEKEVAAGVIEVENVSKIADRAGVNTQKVYMVIHELARKTLN